MMRFVERCEIRPLHCAVLPQLGARHVKGYVDTGSRVGPTEEQVYVSIEALEILSHKFLDIVPRDELKQAQDRITDLEHKLRAAEDELREADKFAEAAEYTLGRFGQHVRNKPGRKPKATSQEA